jgi:Protein of unknown function (DUF2817)
MSELNTFSVDYYRARTRFRQAAHHLGWHIESHPVYQDLTMDVACSLGASHQPTIIISSGLHGAEGFFGSAAQLALMANPLSTAVRWVFIHALNPYGFAHVRRCNEDNIDLNRNFLLPSESYSGSPPEYSKIDPWLNPAHPRSGFDPFWWQAIGSILRKGIKPMQQAISEGQYEFPRGLMFGGKAPSRTLIVLQENLPRWVGDSNQILHLDWHTGLGKSGTYQLLMDTAISDFQLQKLQQYLGSQSIVSNPMDKAYTPRGSIGKWCQQLLLGRFYTYFCAEFGTYPALQVLSGLRRENQAHQWPHPNETAVSPASKSYFEELFCPQSPVWRQQVIQSTQKIVGQSVQAVSARWPTAINMN